MSAVLSVPGRQAAEMRGAGVSDVPLQGTGCWYPNGREGALIDTERNPCMAQALAENRIGLCGDGMI
ncbi:unnamed protein product [Boreogadus saida]